MLYLRICYDRDDAGDLRAQLLKEHRAYIATFLTGRDGVKVAQGGPICGDDSCARNVGSFLVLEADSLDAARAFHENDPFARGGLFARAEVARWDRHIGNSAGEAYVP